MDAAHNVFGEAAIALSGQVAGRIDAARPVADTVGEFGATIEHLAAGTTIA